MTPTSRSVPCLSSASFLWPDRLVWSGWIEHVPFAFWLVEAIAPRVLVELGTHTGASFSAFCQAVQAGNVDCHCHAVDTWQGDKHAGAYGETVFEEISAYLLPRYDGIATLHRATFDEALDHFADGSVDLLHIDGLHTYEAVRHDFESWRPKLSDRAVVLFHDTAVRRGDFGVYQLWAEIEGAFPSFEFQHGNGLGVIAVGEVPEGLAPLVALGGDPAAADLVRKTYHVLGDRLTRALTETDKARENTRLAEAVETYRAQVLRRTQQLEAYIARTKNLEEVGKPSRTPTSDTSPSLRSAEIVVRDFEKFEEFLDFYRHAPDYFSARSIKIEGDLIASRGIYCNVFREFASAGDVVVHDDNYRETIVYRGINSRIRAAHHVYERAISDSGDSNVKVMATEAATPYALHMRGQNPHFVGMACTSDMALRDYLYPLPSGSLDALPFEENTFHAVIANDAYGELPSPDFAFREFARILRPGGKLVSTFSFLGLAAASATRLAGDGTSIEIPGWNILDRVRACGFRNATMSWVYSVDSGMLTADFGGVFVLTAEK